MLRSVSKRTSEQVSFNEYQRVNKNILIVQSVIRAAMRVSLRNWWTNVSRPKTAMKSGKTLSLSRCVCFLYVN